MQEAYYTTGEFAKRASVSVRTIRYYDQKGLLSPSFIGENGYRLYTDSDFAKLQKILTLKYLGFSLDEILNLTLTDDKEQEFVKNSLIMQRKLIDEQIDNLVRVREALDESEKLLAADNAALDWEQMLLLIHMVNMEQDLGEQYKNSTNVDIRIRLHSKYAVNKQGWYPWLYQQLNLKDGMKVLELGCGNGELWKESYEWIPPKTDICLTDNSRGMLRDAKSAIRQAAKRALIGNGGKGSRLDGGNEGQESQNQSQNQNPNTNANPNKESDQSAAVRWSFTVLDANTDSLGEDETYDLIVANHLMFYIKDRDRLLAEISRVLKSGGRFVCSTYGREHMKEITGLVQKYDERIVLSPVALYEVFGLENGGNQLKPYFQHTELIPYEDYLLVDCADDLVDYILSCHGNQHSYLNDQIDAFRGYVARQMEKKPLKITKQCGVWVGEKPITL